MIQKVHVKEGEFVKAGQMLFTLDARADHDPAVEERIALGEVAKIAALRLADLVTDDPEDPA